MTPSRTRLKNTSKLPLALLLRHLPVVDELSTVNGGVIRTGRAHRSRQDDDDREARRALEHAIRQR